MLCCDCLQVPRYFSAPHVWCPCGFRSAASHEDMGACPRSEDRHSRSEVNPSKDQGEQGLDEVGVHSLIVYRSWRCCAYSPNCRVSSCEATSDIRWCLPGRVAIKLPFRTTSCPYVRLSAFSGQHCADFYEDGLDAVRRWTSGCPCWS